MSYLLFFFSLGHDNTVDWGSQTLTINNTNVKVLFSYSRKARGSSVLNCILIAKNRHYCLLFILCSMTRTLLSLLSTFPSCLFVLISIFSHFFLPYCLLPFGMLVVSWRWHICWLALLVTSSNKKICLLVSPCLRVCLLKV